MSSEETGKWVITHYFPHEPAQVYGLFDSEAEAREYAQAQGFAITGAYEVQMVLDVNETT